MRHQESKLQQACVRWFRYAYPEYALLLFAVPNGVATSATQGRILKAEGMVAGVADLILLLPRHGKGSLCMEMKTEKGRQSDNQKNWQQAAESNGNKYVVVRNFDEFQNAVETYISELPNDCIEKEIKTLQNIINM